MKLKLYTLIKLVSPVFLLLLLMQLAQAQDCSTLTATYKVFESRCTATGSIEVTAKGGSGNYNYKADGPVTTTYTSAKTLTGLAAGTYTVYIKDIVRGCEVTVENVVVPGTYSDPRFALNKTDVTCKDASDGTISVTGAMFGRSPFLYTIMAPSPSSVGVTSASGNFSNLKSGEYVIQLSDSCGGKQTRRITILNYDWSIDSKTISNSGCDLVNVSLVVKDNKGNTSTSGTLFSGFKFGYTLAPGDTTYGSSTSFSFHLGNKRSATIVVKDPCGNINKVNWTNTLVPNVAASITTTPNCKTFTAQVGTLTNFSSPTQFKLYNSSNTQIGSNTSGTFTGLDYGSYKMTIYDACYDTTITRNFSLAQQKPSVNASVTYSNLICATFDATVTGQTNLSSPTYTLYDKNNNPVKTSPNGVFTGIAYGTYKIKIADACYDTTISINVVQNVVKPTITAAINVSSYACNTVTLSLAANGFTNAQYCLFNSSNVQVGSCQTSNTFNNVPYGTYTIKVKNDAACFDTTISRSVTSVKKIPTDGTVATANLTCTGFNISVSGTSNLTSAQYCLYKSDGTLYSSCQSTGSFTNLPYGSYCLKIKNDASCYDTTFEHCFTVKKIPPTGPSYSTSNLACTGFTLTLTASTSMKNPTYCLYDKNGVRVGACNTTGKFTNVPYGHYCVRTQNDPSCYDTLFTQCFDVDKPVPAIGNYSIVNKQCATFDVNMSAGTNLNNPSYSLYDNHGNKIGSSNSNGTFTNVPYGVYCIRMKNDPACYDTTISGCFTVLRPIPTGGNYTVSNATCTGFDATISGSANLTGPKYTLYDGSGNQVGGVSTTGNFTNIPYGAYTVKIKNDPCYDTTITRTFVMAHPILSVDNNVTITKGCTTFDAKIVGQSNLTGPTYTLYNSVGTAVGSANTNGVFSAVPYGSYCIKIKDGCYDTTISRCFVVQPNPITISLTAAQACTIGTTDIKVVFNSGSSPYTVTAYDPAGNIVKTITSASNNVTLSNLPGLGAGQQYKIKGTDNCSVADSQKITPIVSYVNRTISTTSKCPTAQWENGAALVDITVTSNLGAPTPVIIKKNGVATTINYSITSASNFKFVDIEPATYVVQYTIAGCTGQVYDTVTVAPYTYPGLQQSAAYQCDNNSFSVGASLKGGIGPFTYEVIGSSPETPSIVAPPQSSPIFTFNNGVEYSLVRLRAVDACGNATLNDVNILPLANTIVTASSNCFYTSITLKVDTVPNATFEWYKIKSETDSVLVGTGTKYAIPYLLPDETGVYVAKLSVNSGCLTKLSYFNVTGDCDGLILAGKINLSGKQVIDGNQLNWVASNEGATKKYYIERSAFNANSFKIIDAVEVKGVAGSNRYSYTDHTADAAINSYRLRIVSADGSYTYSNAVTIKTEDKGMVSVMPNPVQNDFNISINGKKEQDYQLSLYNAAGQCVMAKKEVNIQSTILKYGRGNIAPGIYILQVANLSTGATTVYKVLFR